jgi:hypothetical protein
MLALSSQSRTTSYSDRVAKSSASSTGSFQRWAKTLKSICAAGRRAGSAEGAWEESSAW